MQKTEKIHRYKPMSAQILLFALPIMLTGILQLLYNSADSIVLGKFSGNPNDIGSVGCTTTATNLLINILMGLSAGTSVLVAQFYGARDKEKISKTVHTSMALSLIGGVVILVAGELLSAPLLKLLGTKTELYDAALLYMRIIFLGVPALSVFNFGAAIVRSIGDAKTPLIILSASGLINVILNLVFVIAFKMGVAGVALATIISQYASAAAICTVLMRTDSDIKLSVRKLGINLHILSRMLKIAIPSAIQSSLFSVSNMLMASAVNTFSAEQVSGNAVSSSLENFVYTALNSYYTATLTFVGQSYGAKEYKRTRRVLLASLIQVTAIGLITASFMTVFSNQFASFFVDKNAANAGEIIAAATEKMSIMLIPYVLCGYMETFTGFLRGWGYSLVPMLSSVFFVCIVRIIWVQFFFPLEVFHSFGGLFIIYPITWFAASLFMLCMSLIISRKGHIEKLMSEA